MNGDWQPSSETLVWMKERYAHVDEVHEREKFRSYWQGRGELRRDWQGAYRNWIIRIRDYPTKANGPESKSWRRRTSDWDMKPAAGPTGQTKFLQQFNKKETDHD